MPNDPLHVGMCQGEAVEPVPCQHGGASGSSSVADPRLAKVSDDMAKVRQYESADFPASLEVGLLGSFHALWKQQVQAAGLNGAHVVALIRVHGRRRDAVGASSQVEKRQRAKESEPNTLAASCPWYPGPRSSQWYLNTR